MIEISACALCRAPLPLDSREGAGVPRGADQMRQHHVLKLGELQYIELAHVECAALDPHATPGYWK